jgi:hypothetical protein
VASLFVDPPLVAPMAHYSEKYRVAVPHTKTSADRALPLGALYILSPESDATMVTLSRLSERDACMALIRNTFQLDVTDRSRAAGLFIAASDIVRQSPVFTLTYPRDFARLPDVRAAILRQPMPCAALDRTSSTGLAG